ncbi:hypothetical protein EVAR_62741_1 [Eumeta japonica]|uniref:Uncharacterized protein n=1 Tax=Eumeta variegata TaxID=151549 RepID=A0A4C1ZBE3_EUMVA|nr:hypothetical protein EVAR_62741_1 [Eumeta japonica]
MKSFAPCPGDYVKPPSPVRLHRSGENRKWGRRGAVARLLHGAPAERDVRHAVSSHSFGRTSPHRGRRQPVTGDRRRRMFTARDGIAPDRRRRRSDRQIRRLTQRDASMNALSR